LDAVLDVDLLIARRTDALDGLAQQRHRRLAVGAGVAAAVAILVPLAVAGGGLDRADRTPPPASQSPSVERVAFHTRLSLDGASPGDAPGIEYFTADGVVLPGRGLVEQTTNWQGLVASEADGGWVAYGPARDEVRFLGRDFEDRGGSSAGDAFVTSADRSYVAWTATESGGQTLRLHPTTGSGEDERWGFPAAPPVTPVGVLGDDRVVFKTTDQQDGHVTVAIAEPDGTISEFADVANAVAVSSDGLVSVMTRSLPDESGCFGVVDAAVDPTSVVWETCDHSLGVFSPDGRYVLAGPAYLDGSGDRTLAVLDARTQREVAVFDQRAAGRLVIGQHVWESGTSVLAVASEGERQTLLRLGVDGSLERATDVVTGGPFDDVAFWLGDERGRH
jgi:hypothetical protein